MNKVFGDKMSVTKEMLVILKKCLCKHLTSRVILYIIEQK